MHTTQVKPATPARAEELLGQLRSAMQAGDVPRVQELQEIIDTEGAHRFYVPEGSEWPFASGMDFVRAVAEQEVPEPGETVPGADDIAMAQVAALNAAFDLAFPQRDQVALTTRATNQWDGIGQIADDGWEDVPEPPEGWEGRVIARA